MVGNMTRESINQPANNGAAAPPAQEGGDGGAPPVTPTLQITAQPQSATASVNTTVTFTVQANVSPIPGPISYQWYRSTDDGFAYAQVTGATSNSLSFTALGYMSNYKYKVELRGPAPANNASNSPLMSNVATLSVSGLGGGQGDTDFSSTAVKYDTTSVTYDAT